MKDHTEKVLASFDEKFGMSLARGRAIGGSMKDAQSFLTSALSSRDAEWRKRIEQKRDADLHFPMQFVDSPEDKFSVGYQKALSDLLAVEEEPVM